MDLGDYFWPRWIKRGHCGKLEDADGEDEDEEDEDTSKAVAKFDCSWPRGMRCAAGKTKVLNILRWHCRRRPVSSSGAKRYKYKCRWYKVPYPVTESCRCA